MNCGIPPIRVLPGAVVQRIAAGEIVERPASVVKELIENAIDAGATSVRVELAGGGLDLIRVSDNGAGIPAAQLITACAWHATSKLPSDDLDAIATLGFRGEALPSIASVAELTILSRTADASVGRRLILRDGQVTQEVAAPRSPGTTVSARWLFQRRPARLAAMSRPQAETFHCVEAARRLALAAPSVAVAVAIEGREVLRTSGCGDLATVLTELYGATLAGRLTALAEVHAGAARIAGIVGSAEVSRPNRSQLHLVVNGRWVQPRGLLAWIEAGYRAALPKGRHPVGALAIEVPGDRLDVNVHPTKLEVRLLDERAIGEAIGAVLRAELSRTPVVPRRRPLVGTAALGELSAREERESYDDDRPIESPGLPELRLLGQLDRSLILLEGRDGLYLVDQHRAHERVIYESLVTDAQTEPIALTEPLALELPPGPGGVLARRLADLQALGFGLEVIGGRTFVVRQVPNLPGVIDGLAGAGASALGQRDGISVVLRELSEPWAEGAGALDWRERITVALACRTGVRRGRLLTSSQMRGLVKALGLCRAPAVCPHGSPLLMRVSREMLARELQW